MMRTSFDATPASGTITFNHTDDFVSVLLFAVQVSENPQQNDYSYANIYCIHDSSFLYRYLFMQTSEC
jgi:hypothetical protein